MAGFLYNLLIMPIQILVEFTYSIMTNLLGNKGIAIIAVSVVIQTLVLPLYKRADKLQEEELNKQKNMSKYVKHIKKSFKGDERYMMLNTYYREENYKVWFPLKSSLSLFLQVPFFMAAYNFLSNLEELQGVSFWFINDLGMPDRTYVIGGMVINLLPIAMTVFNLISGVIYTKGQPLKSKGQVWLLAFVFLALLYNSPSGLVLYWSCNNLYSLLKNLIMSFSKRIYHKKNSNIILDSETLQPTNNASNDDKLRYSSILVLLESALMTIVMGALIPLNVISASATEFILADQNPLYIAANSLNIYAGVFLVWILIFYWIMPNNVKREFTLVYAGICAVAIVNYLIYGNKLGDMTPLLKYDEGLHFDVVQNIICIVIDAVLLCAIYYACKRKPKIIAFFILTCTICCSVVCVSYVTRINKDIKLYYANMDRKAGANIATLSQKGTNVVVIMLDRAMGIYMPYILDEIPELKKQLDGFTFYPNTLSFGRYTNFAAPALLGGYEYTPLEMNKRTTESIGDKHNEALKVMPKIFSDNGYNVTVCDPPYAGYSVEPDLSIYDDIENVSAYITKGNYNEVVSDLANNIVQKRNFIYYSMIKVLPTVIQGKLYFDGKYCTTAKTKESESSEFLDWYNAFASLDVMTNVTSDDSDNVLILQNSMTHEQEVLKSPQYVPSDDVDIAEELEKCKEKELNGVKLINKDETDLAHYQVTVAAIKLLAQWIDYLDKNKVYDNTRIIVVSDHGRHLEQFEDYIFDNGVIVQNYNPLFLYKDFNARGTLEIDDTFMTNADTPSMAIEGVVDSNKNPYTGKEVNVSEKTLHDQVVTSSRFWDVSENNGNTFDTKDAPWFAVHDNIFDRNNWKEYMYK